MATDAARKINVTLQDEGGIAWPRPVFVQVGGDGELPAVLLNPRDSMNVEASGIWLLRTRSDRSVVYAATTWAGTDESGEDD